MGITAPLRPAGPPEDTATVAFIGRAVFTHEGSTALQDFDCQFEFVGYELVERGRVAVITLDRPKQRNAQNRGMLVELGVAFERAEIDDTVRVVVLRGAGPSFSAGHDLGSSDDVRERAPGPGQHPTYGCDGGTLGGVESRHRQEWHYFFENTRRWRNLRKITIAEVHGMVLSAGLMLAWCCDLIVAGEDTVFADVVGTRLGMCGVEFFGHPWEFGPRKAKELLLTGDALGADEAHALGMVSKVFPDDQLSDCTVEFATRIAKLPTATALFIKESVNQTVDAMGFSTALDACFSIHQLNHAYWAEITGDRLGIGTVEHGLEDWRLAPEILPAGKNQP
ncbi:enoyl-CoA hydratase [Mycolicibacterium hippocampi]|uniref:Putative enoyl-CoA hydratase EchA13 n=1 Tax=Mycolicibacterium hippocampi TaxID=659824 RepID=A0A7I9ZT88_9MYCO|nr:putative enoyl-CoA hydratase EchA13 [Mycolicibacterium hippocampi]